MTESSLPWGGTSTGDATIAPYDDDEFSDMWALLMIHDRTEEGVLFTTHPSYNGLLEVTTPGGAAVEVDTGAAFVDGKLYTNTAAVSNTVSGVSVYWFIGLRKDFGAQTVRVFSRGTYLSRAAALSSVVQTDGVLWEIPLAVVLTDASGNVSTIYDERRFVQNMGGIYKIAETTNTASADFQFTSIPQVFSSLKLIGHLKSADTDGNIYLQFNGDGGGNYDYLIDTLDTTDDNVEATQTSSTTYIVIGDCTESGDILGAFGVLVIEIPGYRNTSYYKSAMGMSGHSGSGVTSTNSLANGIWRDTSAINQIDLVIGAAGAIAGSKVTLYGVI